MNKVKLTDGTELTFNKLAVTDLHDTPYVMMLLREKKLNSEDVPEELLSLKDNSGTSVLDICIERFKESVPDNNGRIMPRVFHLMNSNKCKLPLHFRKVKEILRIARENGWSVAHEMASLGYFSPEMMIEDILKLTNASGCSVAYYAAKYTFFPDWAKRRRDILLLGDGQGTLVAHVLVEREKLPSEMMTEEVLKLTDASGCTVAYRAADHFSFPEWAKRRKDILLLGDGHGNYVAHVLIQSDNLPEEMMTPDILKLKDRDGYHIAYYAAKQGSLPEWAKRDRDILMLKNNLGNYVAHMLARRGDLPEESMTEEVLKLTNLKGCSVSYFVAWHNLLPEWAKRRRDILLLGDGKGNYVAHVLAEQGALPIEMMTPDILRLEDRSRQTILTTLILVKHLSPEILLLPWDKKRKVFEYLHSEQFQRQIQDDKETLIYVKKQVVNIIQQQSFHGLLQQKRGCDHDDPEMDIER